MTRKILYLAGIIVLALVIVGVFLPSSVHVQREVTIDAPAATVFALLTDARQLEEWSPWVAPENVATQVEGPGRGVGATLRWNSPAGGRGSQAIVESAPYERVVTELTAGGDGPFVTTFTLDAGEGGTWVGWAFDADFGINLVRRYFGRLLAGRIGRDYEKGLANLKSMAESLPRADWSDLQIEHLEVEQAEIAYLTTSSLPDSEAVSEAMGEAYFRILNFMDRHDLKEAGAPLSISRMFSGSKLVFDAAIPVRGVSEGTPETDNGVRLGQTYGGPAIRAVHVGPYGELPGTYEKIAAYLAAYGIERNGDAWESYESDPARTAAADLKTYVYCPVSE